MKGLKDKGIIVGGGATGIGAALAVRLVREGARVVVGGINFPALEACVARRGGAGGNVIDILSDLADEAPFICDERQVRDTACTNLAPNQDRKSK
jgi:NAD(P)-dependent dehydrogenase (short-subunit alcohol dehydrogenase family)